MSLENKATSFLNSNAARIVLLCLLPLGLSFFFWKTYPFSTELAQKTFSLSSLSPIQRENVDLAARAVDKRVIQPGEEFSFNGVVGPRSDGRGYRAAPSYLGPDSPATVGGGICLLSSALYQAALESNCSVTQRVPHMRTIASVLPGLDATVWYGSVDLKFKNAFKFPIQLSTECKDNNLRVRFLGPDDAPKQERSILHTFVASRTRDELQVEVMKESSGKRSLISRDLYRVSHSGISYSESKAHRSR